MRTSIRRLALLLIATWSPACAHDAAVPPSITSAPAATTFLVVESPRFT